MILRPILDAEPPTQPEFVPAWRAVAERQTLTANTWLLIAQADHAALSGRIAAQVAAPALPPVPEEVVEAIVIHDAGWRKLEGDAGTPLAVHDDERPLSFFEVPPSTFLQAWRFSIEGAAQGSPAGGYIVSRHFGELGRYRLARGDDTLEVQRELRAFLDAETVRQDRLRQAAGNSGDWDAFVPLLQFCDLLSLYLCSGARQAVVFPQDFGGGPVRAQWEHDFVLLDPSPLRRRLQAQVPARWHPAKTAPVAAIEIAVR